MVLPHRKKQGPVWPLRGGAYYNHVEKTRKAAGLVVWPHDALRHCFCSYHYAKHNDAGKTMAQAGHTNPRAFSAHYRARVEPKDAANYWEIKPSSDAAGKVIALA